MVASHDKCVVQSYLAWLQDSDYSPDCQFCCGPLQSPESECVRLVCYCLFHWVCLEQHCRSLPPSTAPAGYTCPACSSPIFPPDNLVSPVADQLRRKLQDVNWARAGLGLPLLDDSAERKPGGAPTGLRPSPEGEAVSDSDHNLPHELVTKKALTVARAAQSDAAVWKQKNDLVTDTVVNFDTPTSRRAGGVGTDLAHSPLIAGDPDSEGNKYKRRTPADWFLRWWKTMMKPAAQRRRSLGGWLMILMVILLGLATLVMVFNYLGRGGKDDPLLDPMNNPNIRVGDLGM